MSASSHTLSSFGFKSPIEIITRYKTDSIYASGFDQALNKSYLSLTDFTPVLSSKVVGWHNARSILLFWERFSGKSVHKDLKKAMGFLLQSNEPIRRCFLLGILGCEVGVL